ncbi:MAG TPA: SDR family oxidoreductase [Aggregatilineales bacterium]|nr:SDR family oxidoreductase [Aggregatilineales bacterium]
MNQALSGKSAIITGAAMGIGKAIATGYVRAGCRVALLDRAAWELDETAQALRAEGGTVFTYGVDLKDADATTRAVQDAIAALGSLHVLVSNAGILRTRPFEQTSIEDFDDHIAINLRPAFVLAKAVYPHFRAQRDGVILMTSSASGIKGFLGESGYVPSKHGLEGLMKALAMEFEPLNIRVNTVTPGHGTHTPLSEANYTEEEKKKWVDPILIAPAYVELATTTATGQRFNAWEISERIRAESATP